jgi:transposase
MARPRAKTGQAISAPRRTPSAIAALEAFLTDASARGDLGEWRRAKAVLGYIQGKRVVVLTSELDVKRNSINTWLRWYEAAGVDGLRSRKAPGPAPKLSAEQLDDLGQIIEAGPLASGYLSSVWTGPMVGDLIRKVYGVGYHNHHVPRLLHQMGFSVQRPRKRLARADAAAQEYWLRVRLPRIKKKQQRAEES